MDKISGILPSSSRVSSVDMKEAAPVRPGTPSFGRPEGVSSLRDAKIGQTAAAASKINQDRLDWKSKDMQHAAIARDMSERFFKGNQTKAPGRAVDMDEPKMNFDSDRRSVPAGFKTDSIDRATGSAAFAGTSMEMEPIEMNISEPMPPMSRSAIDIDPSTTEKTEAAEQPEGLYPRGSFIDFRA